MGKKRTPRRKFTEAQKKKFLNQFENITKYGEKGPWLKKNKISFSLLTHWRKEFGLTKKRSAA